MLLAIDIGNTHIDLGLFNRERLLRQGKLPTDSALDPGRYSQAIQDALGLQQIPVQSAVVASVVRHAVAPIEQACRRLGLTDIQAVDATWDLGLTIAYDNPQYVGIDRLLGALAARAAGPPGRPVVVADAGTAITVDAVTADGTFWGGAIAPGLQLGLRSLAQGTSLLPAVPLRADAPLVTRSTTAGIQAGVLHGAAALLDGLFERFEQRLDGPAWGLLGGGDGPLLWPRTRRYTRLEPALVLRGLQRAFQRRQEGLMAPSKRSGL